MAVRLRGAREREATTRKCPGGPQNANPGGIANPYPPASKGSMAILRGRFPAQGSFSTAKRPGGPSRGWRWTARPVGPMDAAAPVENAWRLAPAPEILEVGRMPVRRFPQSLGKRFAFPTASTGQTCIPYWERSKTKKNTATRGYGKRRPSAGVQPRKSFQPVSLHVTGGGVSHSLPWKLLWVRLSWD
jgi:hypothetical protein